MAFNAKERLTHYTALLTKEGGPNADDLLALHDMLQEDLTGRETAELTGEQSLTEIDRLRDVNHRLFLRVTGGPDTQEVESTGLSGEEQSELAFNALIEKGVL